MEILMFVGFIGLIGIALLYYILKLIFHYEAKILLMLSWIFFIIYVGSAGISKLLR